MIRLSQLFGAHAGRVVEFDKHSIAFGRHPANDVVFHAHADLDASGNHAEIRREPDGYYLIDLGSKNGTWIGSERLSRRRLVTGDVIEFGSGGPRLLVEALVDGSAIAAASEDPALGGQTVRDGSPKPLTNEAHAIGSHPQTGVLFDQHGAAGTGLVPGTPPSTPNTGAPPSPQSASSSARHSKHSPESGAPRQSFSQPNGSLVPHSFSGATAADPTRDHVLPKETAPSQNLASELEVLRAWVRALSVSLVIVFAVAVALALRIVLGG